MALLPLCVSCSHPDAAKVRNRHSVVRLLDRADTMLGTNDSAALAALDSIDATALSGRKLSARYALLYSEAMYKNYITAPDDSLIMVAVRYYSSCYDVGMLFRSFYMLGCIYDELGLATDAAVALVQAENLADNISDEYRLGLLYTKLGNVFFLSFDFERALHYYQSAYNCYEKAGKDQHKIHASYDMGRCLFELDETESAYRLFQAVEELSSACSDWDLVYSSICSQISSSLEMSDIDRATEEIDRLLKLFGYPDSDPFALSLLAKKYALEGQFHKAEIIIHNGWEHSVTAKDSIHMYLSESLLDEKSGIIDSAFIKYEQAIVIQHRNLFLLQHKPALGAMKDYYKEIAQVESLKVSRKQSVLIFLSISFLLFILASVAFVMYGKAKSDAQFEELSLVISDLKLKEDTNNEIINELNSRINLLFSHTYSDLDHIYSKLLEAESYLEIFENRSGKRNDDINLESPSYLYKEIKKSFDELISDKYQKQLDNLINVTYNDIMSRLAAVNLKERELLLLRLSFAGFSPKTISHITRIPIKTFYQIRSRIIRKIYSTSPQDADSICKQLCIKQVNVA